MTLVSDSRNAAPIGIFDSGLGGLSIAVPIQQQLPHESLIYFADSAYCPYGKRSVAFLQQRTHKIVSFLLAQGCKAIVVACNTATVAAVAYLREHFDVPVIGVEPAIRPAAASTATGIVGVLATPTTLGSSQYASLVERHASDRIVLTQACPGWVEAVEAGLANTPETRALVERDVQPLLDAGADTLVLGCTHFPFLRPMIEQVAGKDVRIIDPGEAVSLQLQRQLIHHELLASIKQEANYRFYTSAITNAAQLAWIKSVWPFVPEVELAPPDLL